MADIILSILTLAGALGLFIYGMKVMSEGIQRAAGATMRSILHALTRNKFIGLANGFILTSIIQSSSAVTVLTVGLVNAGLLTVLESMSFIMGANIGTTITGWVVSILGFRVKLHLLSLPIIALGLPMLFSRKGSWPFWGQTLIGLALLFLGLEYLRDAFPDLSAQPELLAFLRRFADFGFLSALIYILAGALLTGVVQSSSALMAVVLVMSANGWLSFYQGAAMLLGANIGTTVTANLAAMVGNIYAKRTALFHLLFNVIGVLWILPILHLFLKGVDWFCQWAFGTTSSFQDIQAVPIALAAFHTAFNIVNALILIFFIPLLHRLLLFCLPGRAEEKAVFRLAYLNSSVSTSDLNLYEVQKAVARFGRHTTLMITLIKNMFITTDKEEQVKLRDEIQQMEIITDQMEVEILAFLGAMSSRELSKEASLKVSLYQRISRELERIADVINGMARALDKKYQDNTWFSPLQRERLLKLFELVDRSLKIMEGHLVAGEGAAHSIQPALEVEEQINAFRNFLRDEHLANVQNEEYNIPAGLVYNNLIASLERIGDHAINVSETLAKDVGNK